MKIKNKKILFLVVVVFSLVLPFNYIHAGLSTDCADAGGDYCTSNADCTAPDVKITISRSAECMSMYNSTTYACCRYQPTRPVKAIGVCAGMQAGDSCGSGGKCTKYANQGLLCVTTIGSETITIPANPDPLADPTVDISPPANPGSGTTTTVSGVTMPTNTGLSEKTVVEILTKFLNWLLQIVGIIAIIGFVISGIMYLVSTGNEEMVTKAKKYMMFCLIGIIVALASFVVIKTIDAILNANIGGM